MKVTARKYAEAVALKLTEWLGNEGYINVINAKLMWFSCTHDVKSDLKPLKELGIKTPKNYYDEKHWLPGEATFDFFLSADNADKIRERVIKERNNE